MPYTVEQYNSLSEAIASGALTVKYADKEVTYRSLADMLRTQQLMEAELFPNNRPRRRKYAAFDKGIFPCQS